MKRKIGSILALVMIFSFLPLRAQADPLITITLEIRGDLEMGTIYHKNIKVSEGATAFNILQMAADQNGIKLDYDDQWGYVTGINGLSQQDKGPNSGWLYMINNISEEVSAGDRILIDGDRALFYYTDDYTKEVEVPVEAAPEKPLPVFKDHSKISAWALPSVEKAIALGMVSGDDQGNINPKNNITRAEFVTLLLVVMNEEPDANFVGMFNDVGEKDWHAKIVEKAAKLGLVKGNDNGAFLPSQTISRQDMAVILARAYQLEGTIPNILDLDQVSDYAKTSVAAVLDKGFMSGIDQSVFGPHEKATREMAISIMMRIVGRMDINEN